MHVILDSTALIADFHLTSVASRGLLEGGKAGVIRLGVPELVLLEVIHKWGQRVEQAIAKAKTAAIEANRVGLEGLKVTVPVLQEEVHRFGISLRQKLEGASVTVYPIPGVSHEFLVNKAEMRSSGRRSLRLE
jgi:predicted nucleic acid-binding protein